MESYLYRPPRKHQRNFRFRDRTSQKLAELTDLANEDAGLVELAGKAISETATLESCVLFVADMVADGKIDLQQLHGLSKRK